MLDYFNLRFGFRYDCPPSNVDRETQRDTGEDLFGSLSTTSFLDSLLNETEPDFYTSCFHCHVFNETRFMVFNIFVFLFIFIRYTSIKIMFKRKSGTIFMNSTIVFGITNYTKIKNFFKLC